MLTGAVLNYVLHDVSMSRSDAGAAAARPLRAGTRRAACRTCTATTGRAERLAALGVTPGAQIRVLQTFPGVVFECDQTDMAVEPAVAAAILVDTTTIRRLLPAALRFCARQVRLRLRTATSLRPELACVRGVQTGAGDAARLDRAASKDPAAGAVRGGHGVSGVAAAPEVEADSARASQPAMARRARVGGGTPHGTGLAPEIRQRGER